MEGNERVGEQSFLGRLKSGPPLPRIRLDGYPPCERPVVAESKFFERTALQPVLALLRRAWKVPNGRRFRIRPPRARKPSVPPRGLGGLVDRVVAPLRESFLAGCRLERQRGRRAPAGAGEPQAWESGEGAPTAAAEPRPEGYFVARILGEDSVRQAPHALQEEALAPPSDVRLAAPPTSMWDEELGELPASYQDDTFLALPRDPSTLWIFWDFSPRTIEEARYGLEDPRVRLRLFGDERLLREVDLALESRSYYLVELEPGRSYKAELFFVGNNGERLIGHPANRMRLPTKGPSPLIDDRFATIPWGMPLHGGLDLFAAGMIGPWLSDAEREALRVASGSGGPLGASENLGGGTASGRPLYSDRDR